MSGSDSNHLRGTLELVILKSLSWGPRHGYGIAEWIGRATDEALLVEEGTLYPALHRLEKKGWIEAAWGVSENNRRAKFYDLTPLGRRRLSEESRSWRRHVEAVAKALAAASAEPTA